MEGVVAMWIVRWTADYAAWVHWPSLGHCDMILSKTLLLVSLYTQVYAWVGNLVME